MIQISNDPGERRQQAADLLLAPDLWAATIFGWQVPRFHSWFWDFLTSEHKKITALMPGGHAKTAIGSMAFPIFMLCTNPKLRIAIVQKDDRQAIKIVRAIRRQLTFNRNLNLLYGPFKPDSSDPEEADFPWSTQELRIHGNTTDFEENNIEGFGAGSESILGGRFEIVCLDDVAHDKNSLTSYQRKKLSNWQKTVVNVTLLNVDANFGWLRQYGTAFAHNDLYFEKKKTASAIIEPHDWPRPSEVDGSGYIFIRKDAEVGMLPGQDCIWPENPSTTRAMLNRIKADDGPTHYNRRLRNIVVDAESQIFREITLRGGIDENNVKYPGCIDGDRSYGQKIIGFRHICGADPASGKDTIRSKQFAHIVCAVKADDRRIYIADTLTAPIPLSRGGEDNLAALRRGDYDGKSQVGTIVYRHHKYDAKETVIEDNGVQRGWTDVVKANDPTMSVRPMHTGTNKISTTVGVESMVGMFESGLIRLAGGDATSRRLTEELIEQLTQYPNGDYTDLVMALWFCYSRSKRTGGFKIFDMEDYMSDVIEIPIEEIEDLSMTAGGEYFGGGMK